MRATIYEIRVRGHLRPQWSEWFDGMEIVHQEDGDMVLRGAVLDQPALYGLLNKIRDLGLTLVALNTIELPRTSEFSIPAYNA